jgi:N-acetylglucosamine-6-phosphate deacetylase
MIFRNARCIFAGEIREQLEIAVENGRITAIRDAGGNSASGDVDLNGHYLAPGFIDLHVHGAMGHDTMEASSKAFRAIFDYHATGGTTSLCLTTATAPIDEIVEVLKAIRASRQALPQIAGAHVEGPFLSKEKPGAQRAEFIRNPDAEVVARFLEYSEVIRRITLAPELPGALAAIRAFSNAGMSVSGGHSNAWDEEARAAFECGMRSVTHTFNCMSSARRRGVERVAGLLEFALSEPTISCELIADGHHVSPTLMKMLLRAKSVAGICLVTDATAGAGLPEGASFLLAGKPCVVRGGVCLLADGSALAGSASRMIDLVRVMVRRVGVSLHEAVKMATENPARVIGLHRKGRLEIGADADLVVMSDELEVLKTYVGGRECFSYSQ